MTQPNTLQLIQSHVEHISSTRDLQDSSLPNPTESRCYLVTATFLPLENRATNSISITPTKCLIHFEQFYVHMLSKFINNYTRKRDLQPLTYAYVDYPFSKRHKTYAHLPDFQKMKRNSRAAKAHPEMTPHVHAVMLIHPDVHDKFKATIPKLEPTFKKLSTINMGLDIRHLPTPDDLTSATFYSAASVIKPHPDLRNAEPFTVLPKSMSEPIYTKSQVDKEIAETLKSDRAFRQRNTSGIL